jgi:hypothetical protein
MRRHTNIMSERVLGDAAIKDIQNTTNARALAWRDLMATGRVLTFDGCNGKIITAGKYHQAVGTETYAVFVGNERHDRLFPWDAACLIISYCGRKLPKSITEATK